MLSEIIRWNLKPKAKRLPPYFIVFVTYRCNSRCKTCFYHKQLNTEKSADLPLAFYEKLSLSVGHPIWLHLSGGEPFLRQDIAELVSSFYKNAGVRQVGIPTNCLLGQRISDSTRQILELCPDLRLNIVLSLDGLEKTHNYIRGIPDNWDKTMMTLESLKELRGEYPNLSINICTVLNNLNVDEVPELFRYVRTLGVNFHDLGLMRGDFQDKSLALPPLEKTREALKIAKDYARQYYAEDRKYPGVSALRAARVHSYLNDTYLRYLSSGTHSQPCFSGDGFAVIEPDGDVKMCELTPPVGNLMAFDGNFMAFWQSDKIKALRSKSICAEAGCTHSNFQTRNFLLNPRQWWRALP